MISIDIENGLIVIKGEKEELQILEGYLCSDKILQEGGVSLTKNHIKVIVLNDLQKILDDINPDNFVAEYRLLFPEGVSEIYEKPFRGNLKKCLDNMKKFKKEFKFSNEEILEATKKMVDRHIAKGKKDWIPQAHYFIYKRDRGSDLATECENLKNGTSEQFNKWK
jgi:hypothetical protein